MTPRLLLFDIDGTLLSVPGIPKKAMSTVLSRRYSGFNFDVSYDFSGRTDRLIIEHLLQYDNREISDNLVTEILDEFCIELEREIYDGYEPEIYPGVVRLIRRLEKTAELHHYFPVGGFGDDAKDRNQLPPIARKRAETYYHTTFKPENIFIIGDSVRDISCAHINGFRCLAVSTGKTSKEDLAAANPDFLESDLSELERILDILLHR